MTQNERRSLGTVGPGFLGSTSFSSVYNENRSLIPLHPDPLEHIDSATHGKTESLSLLNRDSKIRRGADCLSLLRDWPAYDLLIRKWHAEAESMIAPWLLECYSSVKTELYDRLGPSDGEFEHQLRGFSARIFDNTVRPLTLRRDYTLHQYVDQFTAKNIRWETVGTFFTSTGLAAMAVEDTSAAPNSAEKRYFLAKQMLEAGDMCISFCEEFQQVNDPELWLISENLHLCTLVTGDASYLSWVRLGNFISACVAKGLHGEIEVTNDVPFWMSELRKRLFACCYIFDKTISNFLGRPPRLLRKYCTMQLPLDLRSDDLRLPDAELEAVVNKLDQHGWNTNGSFGGMVWVRCHVICCMICEDIIELALGSLPEDDGSLGQNIMRRLQDAWNSLPSFITDASAFPLKSTYEKYALDSIALSFRYNNFLLQRALVKRAQIENHDLIAISRELFAIVLRIIHSNRTGQFACDIPWMVAQYALPVAGVLGLELLQQTHHQKWVDPAFPRSEVIQGLSNLVAAMKWVIPKQDGNYGFCTQARQVLQRILDIVLDPDRDENRTTSLANGVEEDEATDSSSAWSYEMVSEPEFWSALPNHPLLAYASA